MRVIDIAEATKALQAVVARQPDGHNTECVNFTVVNGERVPCCIVGQALDVLGLGFHDVDGAQSAQTLPELGNFDAIGLPAVFTTGAKFMFATVQEEADSWIDDHNFSRHPKWVDVLAKKL